jgi:hypothetical protein
LLSGENQSRKNLKKFKTMKLEIKHLAPYLPYKICGVCEGEHAIELVLGVYENEIITDIDGTTYDNFKPILRPLSDLTKEIEHNGEKFVPIEWFEIGDDDNWFYEFDSGNIRLIKNLATISKHNLSHDIKFLPFAVTQQLIEWHFDVFGLIENKLAIDINTITK